MVSTVDIERAKDGFINVRSVRATADSKYDFDGSYRVNRSLFMNSYMSPDWSRAQKLYIEFDQETPFKGNLNLLNSIVRVGLYGEFMERVEFEKSQISDNLYVADVSDFRSYHASQGLGVEGGLPFNARVKVWIDYEEEIEYKGHRNFIKTPPYDKFIIKMTIYPNGNGWYRCNKSFIIMRCAERALLLNIGGWGPGGSRYITVGIPGTNGIVSQGGPIFIGGELTQSITFNIPCLFKRDINTGKIAALEIGLVEWTIRNDHVGFVSPTYRFPNVTTIEDPTNRYHISLLDHFYGEVENLAILEGHESQDLVTYKEIPISGIAPSAMDNTNWWNKLGYTLSDGAAASDALLTKLSALGVTVPNNLYSVSATATHEAEWTELNNFIINNIPPFDTSAEYKKGMLVRDFFNFRVGPPDSFLAWCFFECYGSGQREVVSRFKGDNMIGNVVSMIRDYETNELHAIVSPDRAGLRKDGKIREYLLENNKATPLVSSIDADDLNNLQYGQVGYNENGKFELLNIRKNNWEYNFRNILQRKDRPKRLAIPSKMKFVNTKPFMNSTNKYQLSYVNFIESASGKGTYIDPNDFDPNPIVVPVIPPPQEVEEEGNHLLFVS